MGNYKTDDRLKEEANHTCRREMAGNPGLEVSELRLEAHAEKLAVLLVLVVRVGPFIASPVELPQLVLDVLYADEPHEDMVLFEVAARLKDIAAPGHPWRIV